MASKNLGAVIQRAISDGAFRRQLQSDPAAALRGFNLTPTEIAAIRSGDASKLMSLGVDQRVSKAFTVGGGFLPTRAAVSDMGTGAQSSGIIGDPAAATRDAITTGNASGTRAVNDPAPFDSGRLGVTDPTLSGTRAVNDPAPFDGGRSTVSDPTLSGTRAVNDPAPFDGGRSTVSDPTLSGTRAVHDVAPFDSGRLDTSDPSVSARAVHDVAPFEGNANAAAATPAGTSAIEDVNSPEYAATQHAVDLSGTSGDPYSGQYQGVSPDFQANLNQAAGDTLGPDGNVIGVSPTVASQMADAGTTDAGRAIHDVAPFDSGINAAAPSGGEFLGDVQHDPGDVSKTFVPSDSADVQREMLDGLHDGGALGNTGGGTGNTES